MISLQSFLYENISF